MDHYGVHQMGPILTVLLFVESDLPVFGLWGLRVWWTVSSSKIRCFDMLCCPRGPPQPQSLVCIFKDDENRRLSSFCNQRSFESLAYVYLWWFMFSNGILQGVRTTWVYHITWLVNSACHVWGKQAWNTGDLSRNNWWVALLSFGEGWHNNHHAFEFSARHGLEWWQLDLTWYMIRLLQEVGLATDVKLPSEVQRQRLALGAANWVWFDF